MIRIWMSPLVGGPAESLTRETSPRSMKSHVRSSVLLGELQLGQFALVLAELVRQLIDLGAQRALEAIVGAGLGGARGLVEIGQVIGRVAVASWRTVDVVKLVAERLPAHERLAVGLAISLPDAP